MALSHCIEPVCHVNVSREEIDDICRLTPRLATLGGLAPMTLIDLIESTRVVIRSAELALTLPHVQGRNPLASNARAV